MITKRIIPVLLLKNGALVRSQNFDVHQLIGNPYIQLERYNEWNLDELIYIDISDSLSSETIEILKTIANKCFMPLTFGGGIKSLKDIEQRLNLGADKITINTQAIETPELITQAAVEFGQQAIIVSIDVKMIGSEYKVVSHGGRRETHLDPIAWAKEAQQRGAGELFIQSIERDGMGNGYDLYLMDKIAKSTNIPVIACSGAKDPEDFHLLLTQTDASAAAAANVFLFKELSYFSIKQNLTNKALPIRAPSLQRS